MIKHEAASWQKKRTMLEGIQKGEIADPIPPYIRDVPIELTIAGQINLLAYPEEGVVTAVQRLQQAGAVLHPYDFLITTITTWCRNNSIHPDHKWVEQLREAYSIPSNAPLYKDPKRYVDGIGWYAGKRVRILSDDQAEKRRNEFICSDDFAPGIAKLATFMGEQQARNYVARIIHNLKYVEL